MAFSFVNQITIANANSGSATKTINAPASIVSGDLLIAFITIGSASVTVSSAPSGWTQRANRSGNLMNVYVYSKIATGSEPASYSWTLSAAQYTDIGIGHWNGNDQSSEFDAEADAIDGAAGTSHVAPSITTGRANNLITTYFTDLNSTINSLTAPSGETQRLSWDQSNFVNDETQASAGASGTKTATTPTSPRTINITLSWNVAAAANPALNYEDKIGITARALRYEPEQNLTATLYQATSQPSQTIYAKIEDRGAVIKAVKSIDVGSPAILIAPPSPTVNAIEDRVLRLGRPFPSLDVGNTTIQAVTPVFQMPIERTLRLGQPAREDTWYNVSFMTTQSLPVGQQAPEWSKPLRTLVRDVEQNLTATLYQQVVTVTQKLLSLMGLGQ